MHSKRPYGFRFHDFFYLCHMRIFITFLLATVIGATAYAVDFRLRDFNDDDFRIAQVKTELTLVFLYNSDCDACRKGAAQIEKRRLRSNSLTTAKKLKGVSVANV